MRKFIKIISPAATNAVATEIEVEAFSFSCEAESINLPKMRDNKTVRQKADGIKYLA